MEKFCVALMELVNVYNGQNWGLEKVGINDGIEVGSTVGKTDGTAVDGTAVGVAVGVTVGIAVGIAVGIPVGMAVGMVDGIAVVGKADGIGVGDCVRLNLVAMKRPVQAALPTQPWYILNGAQGLFAGRV